MNNGMLLLRIRFVVKYPFASYTEVHARAAKNIESTEGAPQSGKSYVMCTPITRANH